MISSRWPLCALAVVAVLSSRSLVAQEDVADIPSQDLRAGDDQKKRYFLIGPVDATDPPESGFGLIVVMPGGDGSADFHPFVKRIYKHAVPDGYIIAQPVAVKWSPRQQIVWPTAANPVRGMKFTTEEFVAAVIEDASQRHKIDPARVFTLTWSSSGPAAYAIALNDDTVRGSLIAMSVFRTTGLPLESAKDRAFYLYHSPEDRVCPYRMAQQAERTLKMHGAKVELATYSGGHGWRGPLYQDLRTGIEWLEQNAPE